MGTEAEDLISELLTGVAEDLDVPETVEANIHWLYGDMSTWMSDTLSDGEWSIHPQGSGRLGTMVRRDDAEGCDIDGVIVKRVEKERITQESLKATVRSALSQYVSARTAAPAPRFTSLSEDRRCFTLESTEPIHMDLLPAVPNLGDDTALWIPDRDLVRWQPSDPVGFADWFFEQMSAQVILAREAFAKRAEVNIEDVPTWRVRTPLQRAVQVFKAHRNCYFSPGDPNHASSIVITATAAMSYRGEASLFDAVMSAAERMPAYVVRDGLAYRVANPAHPDEDFTDLWSQARATAFFRWIGDLQRTLEAAVGNRSGLHRTADALGSSFGSAPVTRAVERLGLARTEARNRGRLAVSGTGAVGATGLTVKRHTFHGE